MIACLMRSTMAHLRNDAHDQHTSAFSHRQGDSFRPHLHATFVARSPQVRIRPRSPRVIASALFTA